METNNTLFEVIIPVHNEEAVIESCVRNLDKQIVPSQSIIRLIISDNASTDDSSSAVKHLQKRYERNDFKIDYIYTPDQGKGVAVNHASRHLQSEIAISIDVDAYPIKSTLTKMIALLRSDTTIVTTSPMPKRIVTDTTNIWINMEDTYAGLTRLNGSIVGMCYGIKNDLFPEIPLSTASDDTWIEYFAISNYGAQSVQFLGQHEQSDVATLYYGSESFRFLKQLLRWESSFQILMAQNPNFWKACTLADRHIPPKQYNETMRFFSTHFPEIPIRDKLGLFYSLKLIRKLSRYPFIQRRFGPQDGAWTSPKRKLKNSEE